MSESSSKTGKPRPETGHTPPPQRDKGDAASKVWGEDPSNDATTAASALPAPDADNAPTVITKPQPRSNDVPAGPSLRGQKLAHFELIEPVGVGGMAAVIKGRDLQLDRLVALKILPPRMAGDPENVRRFHQEARAAAKLDHENIARVYFSGEDQGLHFIAFEFVEGDNLRTVLERRGRLSVNEAVNYLLQVASGLAHAHARGVIHRDVKPSNIIVTPSGRAKLVDMGLARSLAPQDDAGLTHSGVTLGTFDYISPEQALEPREADVRSDIYSLGCTFYHLLTGHPPVPEGTAAKKLHHHQHVAPLDPRQLNPEIPDDLAAILGRMMAKEPRDRYQQPEQLVQHLLQVARRLDAGPEGRDGVLFVDAPLPLPPSRPVFLVALAVAALVTLVLVLDQPQASSPASFPTPRALDDGTGDRKRPDAFPVRPPDSSSETKRDQTPQAGQSTSTFYFEGKTLADLRKFVRNIPSTGEVDVVLGEDLILSEKDKPVSDREPGLEIKARKITLRAANGKRPTVRLVYNAHPVKPGSVWTALSLHGEQITVSGLRFLLDAGGTHSLVGLALVGGREHRIEDCQFVQAAPIVQAARGPDDSQRTCSVQVQGEARSVPVVTLRSCVFAGAEEVEAPESEEGWKLRRSPAGGDAVVRQGAVVLRAEDCVFGPHAACFRLAGTANPGERDLELAHCSVLMADGAAVFEVGERSARQIRAEYCLFSRPGGEGGSERPAVLLRLENDRAIQYLGLDNRYHGLDFLADAPRRAEFLTWIEQSGGQDANSRLLETSPWHDSDPLSRLASFELARAFRVSNAREARPSGRVPSLLGARHCAGVSYEPPRELTVEPLPPSRTREKIVDPSAARTGNGIFRTLAQAFEEAQTGDVILIKATGPLDVGPVTLDRAIELTVKPARGHRPILCLSTRDRESALFRLLDGKLKLEDLEIRLQPPERGYTLQTVVNLLGGGSCRFEDCVVTLATPRGCALSLAVVSESAAVSKRSGEESIPQVSLENCFVRGKGDLVWSRASRGFKLEARNVLAALSGSLLLVDAREKEENNGTDGTPATIELTRVTAAVNGHILHVREGKELKHLVPIQWRPTECLFASVAGSSLVRLSGVDASVDVLKEKFPWEGSKNAYSNFMELLEQQPSSTEMMRRTFNQAAWVKFTNETDSKFSAIKFLKTPEATTLSASQPRDFTPDPSLSSGADLKLIPRPSSDEK